METEGWNEKMEQKLNVLYINIRSIRNKMSDINDIILTHKKIIHLIVLTETWIYPNEENCFNFNNYTALHNCRDTRGGGCSIYIREDLHYVQNNKHKIQIEDCNIVFLYLPKQKLSVIAIYRPPHSNCDVFSNELDKILEQQRNECIIIGDMNLDLLKQTQTINNYQNIIQMNGFKFQNEVLPRNATRVTTNTASILDHIITNKNLACTIKLEDSDISDHKVIYIEIKKLIYLKKKEKVKRRFLMENKWLNNMQGKIEQNQITTFQQLAEIIDTTKNECTKEYSIKIKQNNYWITREYLSKLKEKDALYVRWKRLKNEYCENEFKKAKNKLNNLRKKLQKQYAERRFNEAVGNSKKTWVVLNEICNANKSKNKKIHKIINSTGKTVKNDKEMAQEFNMHFSKVGDTLAAKIKQNSKTLFREEEVKESIILEPTTITEMKETINTLKNSCAPGVDGILKKDLQTLFRIIGTKMVELTNSVLQTGIYPEELKVAKIIPIFKKGDHDDANNYRPISLLSTFSKVLEKIIKTRLIKFIEANFKFDQQQYGFQCKSSTQGAAVDMLEYITNELDKNKYVITVFVDLQKAFDTVNIKLMMNKLHKMGFRGTCYNLLKSYSNGRKHLTTINNENSEQINLNVGVAQGSVLGPILYLLYVHSLKYANLKASYFKFADDTVLVYSGDGAKQIEELVNSDLNQYFSWLCYNRLSLNAQKTVYMVSKQTGKPPLNPQININEVALEKVSEYKYLGLLISDKMTWDKHIETVTAKIVPMIGVIKRCSHQLNQRTKRLLYNSFIEPHFRYLITCWGNTSIALINKLQRLQNKAIKTIFGMNFYVPSEEIYKSLPYLKICELKILEQTKLIYAIQNKLLKTNVKLNENRQYYSYSTRNNQILRNAYARTKKKQDSPIYRSVQAYNKIPKTVLEGMIKEKCHNLKEYLRRNRT